MNTLITILVFAFVLLVAVVVAFLAGLHAAKLGVQEIIRDTLSKNKKQEDNYGFYYPDSDYEDEDEYYPQNSGRQRRVIEEHYTLSGGDAYDYCHASSFHQPQQQQSRWNYIGDNAYLARLPAASWK